MVPPNGNENIDAYYELLFPLKNTINIGMLLAFVLSHNDCLRNHTLAASQTCLVTPKTILFAVIVQCINLL